MKPVFRYTAFGLQIQSTFPLVELTESQFELPDVIIEEGVTPKNIKDARSTGVIYQAKKNELLFRLESVGAYYITDGEKIIVERLNNSTDAELRLFLLGSALGALLIQRALLPVHGSTVVKDNKAYLISGVSGVGKSSLTAYLVKNGYTLLADDITVIKVEENIPMAYPGVPQIKLWHDVLEKLDDDPENYEKVRPQLLKFRKPVLKAGLQPVPLSGFIVLKTKNTPGFTTEEFKGLQKFNSLKNNTYRYLFLEGLEMIDNHFHMVNLLAKCIRVHQISRPLKPILLKELAEVFESLIALEDAGEE